MGFIATRLAGTDGVSLETNKWVNVLEREGIECFFMAGELDRSSACSHLVEEAHFTHPDVEWINEKSFGVHTREIDVTRKIHELRNILKEQIAEFIRKFDIDFLIIENALAIPMNIPLGLAIAETVSETGMPAIAHHHDFFWERDRFLTNAVWEYLNMAFPPHLPSIRHVVINSSGGNQLGLRTGISSTIIPNLMDFAHPPHRDEYAADVRDSFGIEEDELFILQPTRVIKRKGIEHAIELVSRLGMKARLVISHASGDEGNDYEQRVREYARMMGVKALFVSDRIQEFRGTTQSGLKIYTLEDLYPHADLVTYPSTFEGFGNAFLEAVYFQKPIVVNIYSIYRTDIRPKGFDCIELDGYVTESAVQMTREILADEQRKLKMVEKNYTLGKRYYSYDVLERKLPELVRDLLGSI